MKIKNSLVTDKISKINRKNKILVLPIIILNTIIKRINVFMFKTMK